MSGSIRTGFGVRIATRKFLENSDRVAACFSSRWWLDFGVGVGVGLSLGFRPWPAFVLCLLCSFAFVFCL